MIEDKGILIKNIYYMLTYAFRVLKQTNYEDIASEEFDNIEELFASILARGVAQQLKQGLYKEYIGKEENLPLLRGKLAVSGTIKNRLQCKQLLACEYDELSVNNYYNQILKTTSMILIRSSSVNSERKAELKRVMLLFNNIDILEPSQIKWNKLHFQRNNQSYKMLLNICYFVLQGLLLTTDKGHYKMASFLDEQHMCRLYEKFILEYYRYHHPQLQPSASQIPWTLDDSTIDFLPVMQTDIMLKHKDRILIIDAKYYGRILQSQYNKETIHSGNLYQIFTYVKNKDVNNTGNVSGMLLYAKTSEAITPDCDYKMSGNRIAVKTLDLNIPFTGIAAKLDSIVEKYLD